MMQWNKNRARAKKMPLPDAPIEEWIRVFEPKSYHALGYDGPVPVHGYLVELVEARKRLACLDAPDISFDETEDDGTDV